MGGEEDGWTMPEARTRYAFERVSRSVVRGCGGGRDTCNRRHGEDPAEREEIEASGRRKCEGESAPELLPP